MGLRQLPSFAITGLLWCVITGPLFGQAQPASSYTFLNLAVGTTGQYTVEDSLTNWVNINPAIITVRTTLDADDPSYSYSVQCIRPQGQECRACNAPCPPPPNPCPPICQDTCMVFEDTMNGFGSAASHNYWGLAIPINRPKFVGTMIVESLGGQPFYAASPNVWKVIGSSPVSGCEAWYLAWQNASWTDVFYWDSTAQTLISPYANYWRNTPWWDKGWDTTFNVHNNTGQSWHVNIQYVADYERSPVSLNPNTSCGQQFLNTKRSSILQPFQTWTGTLSWIFGIDPSHATGEDGFFSVTGANSEFTGDFTVSPNPSALSVCGASGCPQATCN